MIDIEKIAKDLKIDEGFRECVYECSAGKLTIGYGHNVEDNPIPQSIAEKLLHHDIGQVLSHCERFHWFYPLNGTRKGVIVNMVFNMGSDGVAKFKNMIRAIEDKNWNKAANEMLDSRWATQVGQRAIRLSEEMRNG